MKRYERLQYEMFLRVREFGTAHRQQFPDGSMGANAFRAVAAAVEAIDAYATARMLSGRQGRQARAASREALTDRLAMIARTARVISRSLPGFAAAFHLPHQSSEVALLTAARAFLHESEAAVDRFVLFGLPRTFVADLQELMNRFEQAIDSRRAGRTGLAAARAGMRSAFAQGLDAVQTLDVVVTNTLRDDAVLLGVWKRDRRVKAGTTALPATLQSPALAADMTSLHLRRAVTNHVAGSAAPRAGDPAAGAAFRDVEPTAS